MNKNSLYNGDVYEKNCYPQVNAYYFRQWDDFKMPHFHSHHSVEIMYVLKGKCVVAVTPGDSVKNLDFEMKSGDFILIDANVPHRLLVEKDKPCRMLNIEFSFQAREAFFPSMGSLRRNCRTLDSFLNNEREWLFLKDSGEIYLTLKNLINELGEKREDGELVADALFVQLLVGIARLAAEAEVKIPDIKDIYVRKTEQYLKSHYDYPLKVSAVAAEINIHPIYLHRIFKEKTGRTLVEYLTELRIDKAKMLLSNTDVPIIDISDYIGIGSRQYFTSLFKKHTGMSPALYRKNRIQSQGHRMSQERG